MQYVLFTDVSVDIRQEKFIEIDNHELDLELKFVKCVLKSSLLCLQGSRMVCRKVSEFECGVDVSIEHAKI